MFNKNKFNKNNEFIVLNRNDKFKFLNSCLLLPVFIASKTLQQKIPNYLVAFNRKVRKADAKLKQCLSVLCVPIAIGIFVSTLQPLRLKRSCSTDPKKP
jgi:hypothetical protein